MAKAKTRTLLSLDRFAAVVGMDPIHFNGVNLPGLDPTRACGQIIYQYGWQTADRTALEDIAMMIGDVERRLMDWLGFPPAPMWVSREESTIWPSRWINRSFVQGFKTRWGKLIVPGWEATDLIQAARPIVYSDTDSDNYDETATITVAVGGITDPEEVAIYYPGQGGSPESEVRPISVTIDTTTGTATIVARREQLVKQSVLDSLVVAEDGIDGFVDANFLTEVDVYRHWTNPSTQIKFLYRYNGSCVCGQHCTFAENDGCMMPVDLNLGIYQARQSYWDGSQFLPSSPPYCAYPDRVQAWYKAGDQNYQRSMINMPGHWERAIAQLVLARLDRPLCSCNGMETYAAYWAQEYNANAVTGDSGSTSYQVSRAILDNPFGTSRAAQFVWDLVSQERAGEAVLI